MDQLFYALPIIAVGCLAWDVARRWMTLTHGRLMTADKTQALEREGAALSARVKLLAAESEKAADMLAVYDKRFDAYSERINALARKHEIVAISVDDHSGRICNLLEEVGKRDKAITNVAEEVQKIREKEAMALAGIASLPKKGFSTR